MNKEIITKLLDYADAKFAELRAEVAGADDGGMLESVHARAIRDEVLRLADPINEALNQEAERLNKLAPEIAAAHTAVWQDWLNAPATLSEEGRAAIAADCRDASWEKGYTGHCDICQRKTHFTDIRPGMNCGWKVGYVCSKCSSEDAAFEKPAPYQGRFAEPEPSAALAATPETDAVTFYVGGGYSLTAVVHAVKSKQLERQRDEARAESARLKTDYETLSSDYLTVRRVERAEVERLQMELDASCNAEELRQARAEVARLLAFVQLVEDAEEELKHLNRTLLSSLSCDSRSHDPYKESCKKITAILKALAAVRGDKEEAK
jgi:hypothetical protein